jgi:broad specificity phosphatase PhoE
MARLYLVRHGEAAAGFGDHADPGLSEAGRWQARAAAEALILLGGLPAITSPLARARETANAYVARGDTQLVIDPKFAEVPSPVPLDQRRSWLLSAFPSLADRNAHGSRWSELDPALAAWRDGLVATATLMRDVDVIVFTHFMPINALMSAAMGVDDTIVAWPDYMSVTVFEVGHAGLRLITPPSEAMTVVL